MKAEAAVLVLLAALAPSSSAAARRAAPPDAGTLLRRACAGSVSGFEGVERVQVFPRVGRPRSRGASVLALPGVVRRDWAAGRAKRPGLVSIRDGGGASILWKDRLWTGPDRSAGPEREAALLGALYDAAVSTGGRVAKRRTWRLDLSADGRVRQSLWLDRETGAVLKRESRRTDGSLERRQRFSRFSPGGPDRARFALGVSTGMRALAAPAFWVPDGFVPTGAEPGRLELSDGSARLVVREAAARPPLSGRELVVQGRRLIVLEQGERRAALAPSRGGWTWAEGELPLDDLARIALSSEAP